MPDAFEPWPTGTSVTTRTKGLRLHARRYGDGPATVLLLHGLASESRELGALPTVLAEAGYTVLTPDLRGHGRSQGRRGRLDPEAIREDLDAWKAWAANRDAPVRAIGGHSLGGVWALANAPRFKAKAVLALCSPASITHQLNAVEQLAYRAGGGLQKLAGNRLRAILGGLTRNRFAGIFSGFLITCAIQSSSATTVLVVSFA
ncbi:MAG: alpha/beta fold hydrolase, partial [Candidatus Thermoplasmatota archaeon]|nr:alpha/beta fold hydrolase [Candidatus Thermoplasmatota archaeon]